MKKLVLMISLLIGFTANAKVECTDTCDKVLMSVTEEQKQCVMNRMCKQKYSDKYVNSLKQEIERLKKENAVLAANVKVEVRNEVVEKIVKEEAPKNIASLFVVKSQYGLDVNDSALSTTVENDYRTSLGIMYQRRFFEKLYLGLGADLNQGIKASAGIGF